MGNSIKNERAKRRYFRWLKDAKGYAEMSIRCIEKAIWLYEDFTNHEDYSCYNNRRAVAFKKWLEDKKTGGKSLSSATQYHHLRHLKGFFGWLSSQVGYKSKITSDSISYLSLEKKKVREAIAPKGAKYPSLEYVRQLVVSIEIKTEIDQRDQALIAFLLLSGMRDKAVSTLPLGCFDREKLQIHQFTREGVETKFGKSFDSYLFRFDNVLLKYILDWAEYLEKERLFSSTAPLFPRSKREQIEGGLTFICRKVEPYFWKGTGSIREILKDRAAAAVLEYYHPHSFRHLAVSLATHFCKTPEEFKAVSQNLGHEYVGTTMMTYGRIDAPKVGEIIKDMNFSSKSEDIEKSEIIEQLKKGLERLK